ETFTLRRAWDSFSVVSQPDSDGRYSFDPSSWWLVARKQEQVPGQRRSNLPRHRNGWLAPRSAPHLRGDVDTRRPTVLKTRRAEWPPDWPVRRARCLRVPHGAREDRVGLPR